MGLKRQNRARSVRKGLMKKVCFKCFELFIIFCMQDRSRTQVKVSYAEISQGEGQKKKTVKLWCCGEAFLADFLYGSKKILLRRTMAQ